MKTNMQLWSYLAQLFLEWEMFLAKVYRKNKKNIFNNFYFENRAVYDITWKNIVEPYRPQMAIWRMRITFWVPKATNTNSEYVILMAFPLRQWLHERAWILHYTYIACLVWNIVDAINCKGIFLLLLQSVSSSLRKWRTVSLYLGVEPLLSAEALHSSSFLMLLILHRTCSLVTKLDFLRVLSLIFSCQSSLCNVTRICILVILYDFCFLPA
jgi:hypothetical protein